MARLNAEAVEGKLRRHCGNLAAVARSLAVSRQAVHKFVTARERLRAVCSECREVMKDDAESALYKAVKAGEPWAVRFYLTTQAKDRGYVEKTVLAGDPAAPLNFKVYVSDDGFDPDSA